MFGRQLVAIVGAYLTSCLLAAGSFAQSTLDLRLNGRTFTMPLTTPVLIDQQQATLADLRQFPDGMQMQWVQVQVPVSEKGLGNPIFSYNLIGPVTGTSPLEVLGQPITVTGGTVLAGIGPDLNLPLNTPVVVAGLVDPNGSLLATLIERRGQFGQTFLLSGRVQLVDSQNLQVLIGNQWVSYQGVGFSFCAESVPMIGEYLSVRAQSVPNLQPGSVLTQVISGFCFNPVPAGTPGGAGLVEGIITDVTDPEHFALGALQVQFGTLTQFVFGGRDELATGLPVIVEGSYISADLFDATSIEFVRPVVRFQMPISPGQIVPGESISPYDLLVRASPQVRDEDSILVNGLTQTRQVEVRAYIDQVGRLYATRVRDRGNPNINSVRLRGPVEVIADPLLTVQGMTIDTTGVGFFDEFGVFLSRPQFFALLQQDDLVDISGASFNAGTRTFTGGTMVYIGAEPLPAPAMQPEGNSSFVNSGTVTGYSRVSPLFADGFEG